MREVAHAHAATIIPLHWRAVSCFNKRPDARPHDAANRCEFIVADYYLLECLLVLAGTAV